LNARFKVKDLGRVERVLGIKVEYPDSGGIFLHQNDYATKIISMVNTQTVSSIPLSNRARLNECSEGCELNGADQARFRTLVGSLLYLSMCTRPDLAYACSELSRHLTRAGVEHLEAAYVCVNYIRGTSNLGLHYRNHDFELRTFTDSDHCSHRDRFTRYGYDVYLGVNLVHWVSKGLSDHISCSSCESELYAANEGAKEAKGVSKFKFEIENQRPLKESDMILLDIPCIRIDNQAAVKVISSHGYHAVIKHVDIRIQWCIVEALHKRLTVKHIKGVLNPSDGHTKESNRFKIKMIFLRDVWGLRAIDVSTLEGNAAITVARVGGKLLNAVSETFIAEV
jgi:hypothetical protein